jgi:hypothetical protein
LSEPKRVSTLRLEFFFYYLKTHNLSQSPILLSELIEISNLVSPFNDGCIEDIMAIAAQWLDGIDDTKF